MTFLLFFLAPVPGERRGSFTNQEKKQGAERELHYLAARDERADPLPRAGLWIPPDAVGLRGGSGL